MASIPIPLNALIAVHPTAICDAESIGRGTRIWAFAHVMEGAVVGEDCNICDHVFIESGARIGHRITIKNNALIWDGVTIENDAFIGPGVIFTNDRYPRSSGLAEVSDRYENEADWLVTTTVEEGASIGAGAVIVCGVRIGRFASVGAGAVVTHNVPDHRLVVGNPARIVGWACVCGTALHERKPCPRCGRPFLSSAEPLSSGSTMRS